MTPDLDRQLLALATLVEAGGQVLVALDFDGVLAPLRDDPAASRALPAAVAALDRMAAVEGVDLALVSGRAVDDLAARAEVPDGTWLVGGHGAERARWHGSRDGGRLEREDLDLPPDAAATLARLTADLDAAVEGSTARVEHKPASVVLHTRTATPADAACLTALAVDLGERSAADVMRGKDVVELGVLAVTKGTALAALRTELGSDRVLYAGDDVTDERAFTSMEADDVTVHVGPGPTAARATVADPEAMAAALERLAAHLEAHGPAWS